MSKWTEYQEFCRLAGKIGGVNKTIAITGAALCIISVISTKVIDNLSIKRKNQKAEKNILSILKDHKSENIQLNKEDVVKVKFEYDDAAKININDSKDSYFISYDELLKIIKKGGK